MFTAVKQKFELPPEGNHIGALIHIIDFGTQETTFKGEERAERKIEFGFELPSVLMQDKPNVGKPFVVSRRYKLSMHKKAGLRIMLESWQRKFETDEEAEAYLPNLPKLFLKNGLVLIQHHDGFANIGSITPLPAGMGKQKPVNKMQLFSLHPSVWNPTQDEIAAMPEITRQCVMKFGRMKDVFESLSTRWKEQISKSPEYLALIGKGPAVEPSDNDGFGDPEEDSALSAVPTAAAPAVDFSKLGGKTPTTQAAAIPGRTGRPATVVPTDSDNPFNE